MKSINASATIYVDVCFSIDDDCPVENYALKFSCHAWDNGEEDPTLADSDCIVLLDEDRDSLPDWISPAMIDYAEARAEKKFTRDLEKYAA